MSHLHEQIPLRTLDKKKRKTKHSNLSFFFLSFNTISHNIPVNKAALQANRPNAVTRIRYLNQNDRRHIHAGG